MNAAEKPTKNPKLKSIVSLPCAGAEKAPKPRLKSKCPFCGARAFDSINFSCGTHRYADGVDRKLQSCACGDNERNNMLLEFIEQGRTFSGVHLTNVILRGWINSLKTWRSLSTVKRDPGVSVKLVCGDIVYELQDDETVFVGPMRPNLAKLPTKF